MRFCSLKFQNLARKIDSVNRRWVFYSRAYGKLPKIENIGFMEQFLNSFCSFALNLPQNFDSIRVYTE